MKVLELPINYKTSDWQLRRQAREQYITQQGGHCYHCQFPLGGPPPKSITSKKINWKQFPPKFLSNPVHLHHSHDTDMTIGAVHAYCNAVLWQYYGE